MKNWKKLKMLLTVAAMVMTTPIVANAANNVVEVDENNSYTDEEGITYTFTISGGAATLKTVDTSKAENGCVVTVPGAVTKNDASVDVSKLGRKVFAGNTKIASVDLSDTSISSINMYGFGNTAFENCTALENVKLPETLTKMTNWMFSGCSSLTSVEIPEGVTTFVQGAPSTVAATTPHTRMFENCTSLMQITVADGNTAFKSENGVLFSADGKILYAYPCGKADLEYQVPDTVTAIYSGAFQTAQNLQTVRIPESVTVIGQYAFNGYGTGGQTNNSLKEAVLYCNAKQGTGAFLDSVKITQMVTGVNVTAAEGKNTMNVGEKLQLSAAVEPQKASNAKVIWSTDNEELAEIDQNGELTTKAAGTVEVTATAADGSGKSGKITILITKPIVKVTSITVSAEKKELYVGETTDLRAEVFPADADNKDVIWSVDHTDIAAIDQNGKLTAKAEGNVVITAEAVDNSDVKGSFTITIKVKEVETEPKTEPSTEPKTEPSTEPKTEPKTEPTTQPETQPQTEAPLQAAKQTASQVKIKWKTDRAATAGYRIYVKGGTAKKWTKVTDVKAGASSYVLKKVKGKKIQSGTNYQMRVVSLTKKGSKKVEGRKLELRVTTAPDKVKLTKAKKVKSGTVQLKWKKVRGTSGYEVQMKTSKNAKYQTIKVLGKKSVSYKRSGLGKKETVYFRVRAFKEVSKQRVYGAWAEKKIKI